MMRSLGLGLALLALGCAYQPAASSLSSARTESNPRTGASGTSSADGGGGSLLARPDLARYFTELGVKGTIALFDSAGGGLTCSDVALCTKPVLPASTFKIANSIIALENGAVDDAETVLPWDGQQYQVPAWNRDHTLRTAMQVSCVPCFREIARKVGPERMADWLRRIDYGNHDMSGGADGFWLFGGLRISCVEQIDFLRRFEGNKLPISERTAEIVRDIITLDVGQNHVLFGKTGSARPPESATLAAWFVGWLELEKRRIFFATLIDQAEKDVDPLPLRRRVTENVLSGLGLLPPDRTHEAPGKERP